MVLIIRFTLATFVGFRRPHGCGCETTKSDKRTYSSFLQQLFCDKHCTKGAKVTKCAFRPLRFGRNLLLVTATPY